MRRNKNPTIEFPGDAALLLTTEATITEKPEAKNEARPVPHDQEDTY